MTAAPRSSDLRKGRVSLNGQIYHVTSRAVSGTSPFVDFEPCRATCPTFYPTARTSSVRLLAWVLMPDHVHWLIELQAGGDLSRAVAAFKRQSAGAVNRSQGKPAGSELWQRGFYDRAVRRDEDIVDVARYVVANPLRGGLVTKLGDYAFWDAVWLGS
jgi:putative transposase